MSNLYDWRIISAMPASETVDYMRLIPNQLTSQRRITIGRSDAIDIPRQAWSQIADPVITDESAKDLYVDSYFFTCVFELRGDNGLTLPAHQSQSKKVTISHSSTTRRTFESSFSIENTLSAEGKFSSSDEKTSFVVKDEIKTTYSIKDLQEYVTEDEKTQEIDVNYDTQPSDRTIVWWDFAEVIVLYRKSASGNVTLIGISDYFMNSVARTYGSNGSLQMNSGDVQIQGGDS